MILLTEIQFTEDRVKRESKILINPFYITTIRQPGIYTVLNTIDGQEIKLSDTIFSIKKKIAKYDLSLIDSEVIKKEIK